MAQSLWVAAARHALGALSGDQYKQLADGALTEGIYSPSLVNLLTTDTPYSSDYAVMFGSALEELGIPTPDKSAAHDRVLRYYVRSIAEGGVSPVEGVLSVMREVGRDYLDRPGRHGESESHPARELVGFYYELDYGLYERADTASVEQAVIEFAWEWTREQGQPTIDPAWLRWSGGTVPAVARRIHDDRRWHDLPILADAIQEAGCEDAEILDHCRHPGDHVRGCWVVDLLLGKG